MSEETDGTWTLSRSQDELDAARLLASNGHERQAISRAYYAAFYAAQACLLAAGITRPTHSGVFTSFFNEIVQERGADPEAARLLRSLLGRRTEADYGGHYLGHEATTADAKVAVQDAEAVVNAVDAWLAAATSA